MADDEEKPPGELEPIDHVVRRALARASDSRHRTIEAHLHPHQLRVLAAIRSFGDQAFDKWWSKTGLSRENTQRATTMLVFLGIVEMYGPAYARKVRVVPVEQRPHLPELQFKEK